MGLYIRLLMLFKVYSLYSLGISAEPIASFPLQLSATITITAHLIEPESEYPPRLRNMQITYDYIGKMVTAEVEAGYEAAKFYIRRYDLKNEYMIRHPPINDCKRSNLIEVMPYPEIPDNEFMKEENINGIVCNLFLHTDFETRIHMYFNKDNGAPVRLIQESTENNVSTPLLTYDFTNVILGIQKLELFQIPEPYSHDNCGFHTGGFPYIHIFHYFVRF